MKKISIFVIVCILLSVCFTASISAEEKSTVALDFFDQNAIAHMNQETYEKFSAFQVTEAVKHYSYTIIDYDPTTGQETSREVDKESFYIEVLKQNINTPIDIAMKAYDNSIIESRIQESVSGVNVLDNTVIDTDTDGSVLETTLLDSSSDSSYDYIILNEVWQTIPFLPSRVVNGIGVGSNASIIADLYVAYHDYQITPGGTVIRDHYEPDCKNLSGYAFNHPLLPYTYQNYSMFAVYAHPNVTNLTIFDGFGKASRRTMSVDASLSIDLTGASLSLTPSTGWTHNETHVQHIR